MRDCAAHTPKLSMFLLIGERCVVVLTLTTSSSVNRALHQTDFSVLNAIYKDAAERRRPFWDPQEFLPKLSDIS
jgi:hypothetical protein